MLHVTYVGIMKMKVIDRNYFYWEKVDKQIKKKKSANVMFETTQIKDQ